MTSVREIMATSKQLRYVKIDNMWVAPGGGVECYALVQGGCQGGTYPRVKDT